MRTAWANFVADGDPGSAAVPWPSFNTGSHVLSLTTPQPQIDAGFAATHQCAFWTVG
jgi:carboxylesterase type B